MTEKNEEQKPSMVRFDFPPGMGAKNIAEALREAAKRIMEERQGKQRPAEPPADDKTGE
jgi:hypothetical protein